MFGSFGRTMLRGFIAAVTLSPLFLSAGCADVITYARQSRREGLSLYKQEAYSDAAGAFRNAIRQDPRDYES
ncbi:MAG TPA: hypothetical protein VHP11_12620, partial [Tepidisphaeraceae bacterium]|nr:hypothetical protein [Tepidisphaeraceae bacterium]